MNKCTKCRKRKPDSQFPIDSLGGLSNICIACTAKALDPPPPKPEPKKPRRKKVSEEQRKKHQYLWHKDWVRRNKEAQQKYQRAYYLEHRKKYIERSKKQGKIRTPEQQAARAAQKRQQRFENPIRYCRACLKYLKKEAFSLKDEHTWNLMCDKCISIRS